MISAYLQWLDDVIENNRWNPGVFSRHFECKPLSCRFILGNLRIYFHFLVFHFSQYYNDATSWDLSLGTCLCCMVNTMATDDLVTSVTGQGINRIGLVFPEYSAFHWRHNDHDGASNHQHNGCLLNRLFRRKENIKAPGHWPLCGEFTGTGEFPAQRASYTENVSIWWRHHLAIGIILFVNNDFFGRHCGRNSAQNTTVTSPVDPWRNNNVIITSKRRNVVLT